MQNEDLIREIAARVCHEVMQERSQELAADVARRMGVALAGQQPQRQRTKELRDGVVLIAGSRTQTETLESLLAASSAITSECGLFILRGAQASGWSCVGFTSVDNFKRATLDCSRGVAATVLTSCTAASARASELDTVFTSTLGLAGSALVLLVPVLLKERVAALLMAVSKESDDLAGLELLVQTTQLTLEMHSYRKAPPAHAVEAPHQVPVQAQPTARAHSAEAAEPAYTPIAKIASMEQATRSTESAPAYPGGLATNAAVAQSPAPHFGAPALDEAHEKARRFAKLLVEEIKLYNQTKVAEGRARGDLYSRLREDIEKSRAAYHKRYGESVRDADYFTQELMRILADNDRAVMGAGFPG